MADDVPHEVRLMSKGWNVGYRAGLEAALKLVEARRQKVLADPDDPSWTEHFAELQNEIKALRDQSRGYGVRAAGREGE